MNQKILNILSVCLASFVGFFSLAALFFLIFCGSDLSDRIISTQKRVLPKNTFSQKIEAYTAIKDPVFNLQFAPPKMRLPDLKSLLVYYGKNGRPDANDESIKLHFTFNGQKSVQSVATGEKVYLTIDKKTSPCKYNFSPNNEETNLWFEAKPDSQGASLCVFMKDENNEIVQEPSNFALFQLPEKEFVRFASGQTWEIGKWRVDGTLLARQKARWMGVDLFLEKHGGEEFLNMLGKQRVNFEEGEESYSVFIKAGDCLVWEGNRWSVKPPGSESLGHPLMCVKKVDERIMTFELWDIEGKGKIMLNLIRHHDSNPVQHLAQEFKFVGARTKTQCVFQVNNSRMIVKPNDWLLLTDSGWKKLNSLEDIDDYVNSRITGTLFVLEDIIKKDEKSHLVGTVFNPTRTDMQTIEIAMQPSAHTPPLKEQLINSRNEQNMHTAKAGRGFPVLGNNMSQNTANATNINPLANH